MIDLLIELFVVFFVYLFIPYLLTFPEIAAITRSRMYVANLMRPGVYHPVTRRGEELPPETNLLPLEKDHRFPLTGPVLTTS